MANRVGDGAGTRKILKSARERVRVTKKLANRAGEGRGHLSF